MIKESRDILFRYIVGIIKNKNCNPFIINGVEDHLHIITHIHPSVALADLIKEIKIATNKFIKEKGLFPEFPGWQEGYGAFTYSYDSLTNLIRYVENQEAHHARKTYEDEYVGYLRDYQIDFDPRYLF
jgi:REP element-mobilizing transposase RayT